MKRIFAIMLAAVLMFALFAACGKKDEVKDELTTLKDDMTTAMDEIRDEMSDMGDELTEGGNVTDQTGEGALEEAITDISEMLEGDNKDTTVKGETETTKKR